MLYNIANFGTSVLLLRK